MMNYLASLVLYGLLVLEFSYAAIYTRNWAVHIEGGEDHAKGIIEKHGFVYLGKIMDDYYHIHHMHVAKRSVDPSIEHHSRLESHPEVKWLEQQVVKRRVKRDVSFSDPKWTRMWYLNRGRGLDMNVQPAWQKGITGRNVVVSILDDGIEKDHPDLKRNYDPLASYDVNSHDSDPQPRYDYTNENRHGTRCAGEVAAAADNRICSVGVAYNARIGGVRMLDGDVTDAVEAQSLSHNPQHIDIYSASWGPDDDGRTVDGPAVLAKKAFYDGINIGRGGKGSIFVWASGNGGRDGDSCNCDGYTNSIYTLSISSATENGNIPWYSEACSSTLATTYSSGSGGERQIVTTDLRKGCTETHTGTSASAPLAAGVCALALEANPQLTWRDMQHLVVLTARPENLKAKDWVTNGVGRRVSHSFGYGLMDASGMVDLARNWTSVPEQQICRVKAKIRAGEGIPVYGKIRVSLDTDGCRDDIRNRVVFLEHVQSRITLSSSRRGEVQISLTSPAGTRSVLLQRRSRDLSTEGFNDWNFMTVHNWGELAQGTWNLDVTNGDSTSELRSWTLIMYGTMTHPQGGRRRPMQGPNRPCAKSKFLLYNQCLKECPGNFYASTRNLSFPTQNGTALNYLANVCEQCHTNCSLCFGKEPNECLSCAKGFDLKNSTCIPVKEASNLKSPKLIISIIIITICACIVVFAFVFMIFHFRSQGWCKPSSHYNFMPGGGDSSEPGIAGQRLLDSLSDSSEEDDEHYTRSKVFLDVTQGDLAQYSPIRINGFHQSNI